MDNRIAIRKYRAVENRLKSALAYLDEFKEYEKNHEAATLGAKKALWAVQNRMAELKIHVQK